MVFSFSRLMEGGEMYLCFFRACVGNNYNRGFRSNFAICVSKNCYIIAIYYLTN